MCPVQWCDTVPGSGRVDRVPGVNNGAGRCEVGCVTAWSDRVDPVPPGGFGRGCGHVPRPDGNEPDGSSINVGQVNGFAVVCRVPGGESLHRRAGNRAEFGGFDGGGEAGGVQSGCCFEAASPEGSAATVPAGPA